MIDEAGEELTQPRDDGRNEQHNWLTQDDYTGITDFLSFQISVYRIGL
jgi:hypothetical protein